MKLNKEASKECNKDCVHCTQIAAFCKQNILVAVVQQNTDDIEKIDEAAGIAKDIFTPLKKNAVEKKTLADCNTMISNSTLEL